MNWFKKIFNIKCRHSFVVTVRETQSAMGIDRHAAYVCEKCGLVDKDSIIRGTGHPDISDKFRHQRKIGGGIKVEKHY